MCVWTLFIWHTYRCQIFYLSVAMFTHSAAFSFGFVDTLHGQHVVDAWVQSHLIHDRDPCFFCTNTHKCIQHVNMHFHFSWLYFLIILGGDLFCFILFYFCYAFHFLIKRKIRKCHYKIQSLNFKVTAFYPITFKRLASAIIMWHNKKQD